MNERQYKQRTKVLGIPVVGNGDHIWPETELMKYQIIENMILAGTKGIKNCLFEEGDLSIEKRPDGKFAVVLRATGQSPSAIGIVSGAYFEAPSRLDWEGLEPGKCYFLYLAGGPRTKIDPSLVRTTASEHERKELEKTSILIGKADLRGDNAVLDRYPDGKLYARDLARHVSDSENPHGERQYQDELVVRKRLVLSAQDGAGLEIVAEGGSRCVPASSVIPSVMEFITAGPAGVVLTAVAPVMFVSTSRVHIGNDEAKLGEVSIGYGDANNQSFSVHNTGDAGIQMRALIFHR